MKTLATILVILMTFNVNSQVPYDKLYSKIWTMVFTKTKITVLPVNDDAFDLSKTKNVMSKIDTNKIKQYLLKSFNEFRNDYGVKSVTESDSLSKSCELYSRKIITNFKHENITKGCECIAKVSYALFSNVKPTDGDINKIIADSVFDHFVGSIGHMTFLLGDYDVWGFGLTFKPGLISTVFRGVK